MGLHALDSFQNFICWKSDQKNISKHQVRRRHTQIYGIDFCYPLQKWWALVGDAFLGNLFGVQKSHNFENASLFLRWTWINEAIFALVRNQVCSLGWTPKFILMNKVPSSFTLLYSSRYLLKLLSEVVLKASSFSNSSIRRIFSKNWRE